MQVRGLVATLAAATLALSGCSGGDPTGSPPHDAGRPHRAAPGAGSGAGSKAGSGAAPRNGIGSYVALGDSFTAGPYVPVTDLARGCLRSDGNYPSLLARALRPRRFIDVSCSGADTADITQPQHTFGDATVPPQLRAVRAGTDLVTVGIGGNDFDLFGTLVTTCTRLRDTDPAGSPCADRFRGASPGLVDEARLAGARVADVLRQVHERAPGARVVLVGYLRVAPADGGCPRLLPLADGDYRFVDRVQRTLDRSMARAARRTGARYVDMYAASRGHSVCAQQPWVNGQFTNQSAALAYHPLPAGMRAVATTLTEALHG